MLVDDWLKADPQSDESCHCFDLQEVQVKNYIEGACLACSPAINKITSLPASPFLKLVTVMSGSESSEL